VVSQADCLRVLTVTNRWPNERHHGGIFVKQLVDALRKLGHEVDVEVVTSTRGRSDYALAALRVRRIAASGGYDMVHVHYGLSALSAGLVNNVPRVVTLYGSDINVWWQHWITKIGWRGYAARIYVSKRLAEAADDRSGIIIPNGVDFNRFTPGDRLESRRMVGAQPDDRVLLFGAYPERKVKGWDLFSEVVARLIQQGIRARPLILSEPGQPTDRVVKKLDAADLLLFTSRRGSEGSPTVVKEAIAMGLPVVSVDVGDVAELLAGVEPSAVVAYPDDPRRSHARAELVERLTDAATSVLADGRRANGRARCSWLDLDVVAARVIAVYREALATWR
jgi:teichuronic acid biosynthesis glycosyltransferase TuaC